jgi:glycosyltransferase involved in cell wall biosynthesis
VDRLLGEGAAYALFILAFSERDEKQVVSLLRERPITIKRSRFRTLYRALGEFGEVNGQKSLLVTSLETLCLAPLTILNDVCEWHSNNNNSYTSVMGFPENASPEVIETQLLHTFSRINLPPHMQEPGFIVRSLLESAEAAGQQLPFHLRSIPFDASSTYRLDSPFVPARVSFQTAKDVALMRKVTAASRRKKGRDADRFECLRRLSLRLDSTEDAARPLSMSARKWKLPRGDERPLRVLYTSHASAFAGAQQCLVRLITSLDRDIVEPHVLAGMRGLLTDRLQSNGVFVHCANREFNTNTIDSIKYIMSVVDKVRPHIIHMNGFDGFPIVNLAHFLGIPLIAHLRHSSIGEHRETLRSADAVIAVSETAKRAAVGAGIRPDKINVVHDGIERADALGRRPKSSIRRRMGLSLPGKLVLMAARVSENKRQDVFLDAMAEIKREIQPAHAICVGEPYNFMDVAYHDRLVDQIDRLRIGDAVTLIGFQSDIRVVQAACDVVVSCSRSEALGTSILEAMSLGLPVVATRSGGSCEILTHGETGFLIPEGDIASLKSFLLQLLIDEKLRSRMGNAARAAVRERFSAERCAKAVQSVYQNVLEMRHHPVRPA